jgi:hypothetical protein
MYNEAHHAKKVAQFLGTSHHEEILSPDPALVVEKISQVLKFPISHDLLKTRNTKEQKEFENGYLKTDNVHGAFTFETPSDLVGKRILLIDDIFDRLNRNGEPLTGQELRNAQYHGTSFSRLVSEKASLPFWAERLATLDLSRMEDREFVAEALFVLLKNGPQHANAAEIDGLYEHYCTGDFDFSEQNSQFDVVTKFLDDLNLDFEGFKIRGPSHLYGLWCFAYHCVSINIKPRDVTEKLRDFFTRLRGKQPDDSVSSYRASMSARTKDKSQRQRRLDALKTFCGV